MTIIEKLDKLGYVLTSIQFVEKADGQILIFGGFGNKVYSDVKTIEAELDESSQILEWKSPQIKIFIKNKTNQ